MKRLLLIAAVIASVSASAQEYRNSCFYNRNTDRLEYRYGSHDLGFGAGEAYFGVRIGPSFSTVNSDDKRLDGGESQTGLNVGALVGVPLSRTVPLYMELGLSYIEKGGKKYYTEGGDRKKMTYDLNYVEVPLTLKYIHNFDDHFSIQPLFGGYLAVGVGGKMKNFGNREAQNSFSEDNFERFDGGLRVGCGVAYDLFYFDVSYDIGLANICHDTFDTSHNGCLQLNFGVNF